MSNEQNNVIQYCVDILKDQGITMRCDNSCALIEATLSLLIKKERSLHHSHIRSKFETLKSLAASAGYIVNIYGNLDTSALCYWEGADVNVIKETTQQYLYLKFGVSVERTCSFSTEDMLDSLVANYYGPQNVNVAHELSKDAKLILLTGMCFAFCSKPGDTYSSYLGKIFGDLEEQHLTFFPHQDLVGKDLLEKCSHILNCTETMHEAIERFRDCFNVEKDWSKAPVDEYEFYIAEFMKSHSVHEVINEILRIGREIPKNSTT